jgi:uncharacterized protein with HEPN domain
LDIVETMDRVVIHVGGGKRDTFTGNVTARAAVLHGLTVIGEAVARLRRSFVRGTPAFHGRRS